MRETAFKVVLAAGTGLFLANFGVWLGAVLSSIGYHRLAVAILPRLWWIGSRRGTAGARLAHSLWTLGRRDEADRAFERALRSGKDPAYVHCLYAARLMAEERAAEAAEHYDAARAMARGRRLAPTWLSATLGRARCAFPDQLDEACRLYEEARAREPQSLETAHGLACVAWRSRRWADAARHFAEVLKWGHGDPNAMRYWLGRSLLEAGEHAAAATHFAELLPVAEQAHDSVLLRDCRLWLAWISVAEDHPDEAARQYEAALATDPRCDAALAGLGFLHANRDEWDEAATCYRRAIEANPASAEAQYELGNMLSQQQRWAEARPHFEAAVQLQYTAMEHALYGLAVCAFEAGEPTHAGRLAEAALRVNPRFDLAQTLLDHVGNGAKPPSTAERKCFEDNHP